MRVRHPRVLDTTAIIALFDAHPPVVDLLDQAERGYWNLLLPTTAIADAETHIRVGTGGWEPILLTPGVRSLTLSEHCAIEVGSWPGDLATRHTVHEAYAMRAVVVTRQPGLYEGMLVPLLSV